jgi:hypothetical protein
MELVQLARMSDDLEVPPVKVLYKEGGVGQETYVIADGEVEACEEGKRVLSPAATEVGGAYGDSLTPPTA